MTRRQTLTKLLTISLFIGLLLVSLDITPHNVWVFVQDAGPALENFGRSFWRFGEVLLGCMLAGSALVLPIWLFQRRRKASDDKTAKPVKRPSPPTR
jgi:hypothetical protein